MFLFIRYKWFRCIFPFFLVFFSILELPQEYVQGQTGGWSTPINFSQQPETYSNVSNIICDPYQNLHAFWSETLGMRDGVPQEALYYKNDVGGAWSKPIDLLVTAEFKEERSAITPDNMIHLVWSDWYHNVVYTRSHLSTATQIRQWAKPVVLASNAYYSNIFVDKDGKLYMIYSTTDIDEFLHALYYISSTDSGETWSNAKIILEISTPLPSSVSAQLVVDGSGRFHVVYNVRSNTYGVYSMLGYMRSIDAGENWESPITFPPTTTFQGVNMLAEYSFGDDEIHFTYDIPERLHQWSFDGGETWSQPISIVNGVEVGGAFGGYNQLVKDSSGILHVVFASAAGVFHSTWEGSTWSVAEVIDKPVFDPHGQTMVLCQGNRLSVLYGGNDAKSEIWYSEKMLNIPSIPQLPIPTISPTPEPTQTSVEYIFFDKTPIPTETVVASTPYLKKQSMLFPLTLAVVLIIVLISITFVFGVKSR